MNQYKQVYSNTVPISVMHINGAVNLLLLVCFFYFCTLLDHTKSTCVFLVLVFVGEACADRCRVGWRTFFAQRAFVADLCGQYKVLMTFFSREGKYKNSL
jgi:hypothetical protein